MLLWNLVNNIFETYQFSNIGMQTCYSTLVLFYPSSQLTESNLFAMLYKIHITTFNEHKLKGLEQGCE
jgi:hypothetical protein